MNGRARISEKGCFWIFHDWGKWKQYKWVGRLVRDHLGAVEVLGAPQSNYSETRQNRTCKRCGLMQDRLVKSG